MSDSLSIILYSGAFDRIHYGLMLASSAAAINRKVTLFVTMAACHAFTQAGVDKLSLSDGVSSMPVINVEEMQAYYQQNGIASFNDLLEACAEFGVNFLVCEMGLHAVGLKLADLEATLRFTECGLVTLLHASEDGQIIFI